jgi:succinoglycan biosynthesis transport protein ExoP
MAHTSESSLHFSEYFRIIRNRLWVIFTIFALTLISGIYVTEQVLPKTYTSTGPIKIQSAENHTAIGTLNEGAERPMDTTEFQSEYEIMHSPEVLTPIIHSLGLNKTWATRVFKATTDTIPDEDALTYMNSMLSIVYTHGTNLVNVSFRSQVPKEAADVANAVIDSYKSMRDDEQKQKSTVGVSSLQDQIADQQKVVDAAKANREKLRKDLKISVQGGAGTTDSSAVQLQGEELEAREKDLLQAKEDADRRRVLVEQTKDLPDDKLISILEALQRAPGNITTLQSDILSLEASRDNLLKQGFDLQHPRVLAVDAQLAREREQFATLIAGARGALKLDEEMADSGVALLQKEVDELKAASIDEESTHIAPYNDAAHEYDKQQALLDTLNIRYKENAGDYHLLESPVKVVTRAQVSEYPSSPNVNLNIAISAFAGLFCGLIVAFVIEYLDTSVKTMADAEQLLGLPVLTIIPNKGGPMPLSQQSARLPHAEGYRILRAKLDLKVQNGLGPSVTMLSGGPGEGKSTTNYNLAIVCAQAGQTVILVDCDLRRPTLHDLLDVSNDRGVSNYLRGEGDILEYIQQTALPKLHVLTAGETPIAEIGNFSGDKIRSMLDELKQRYDLVLIDSPPVLGISDGSIIAREVDYVILVVQHRRFPREVSLRAKRAIEEVHGNCVGMVLNAVAVKSDDSYYYYSSYGSYYEKPGKRRRKKKAQLNGHGEPEVKTVRIGSEDSKEF